MNFAFNFNSRPYIKDKLMMVEAGVTEATMGCDLLISRREIAQFEDAGFTLRAGR